MRYTHLESKHNLESPSLIVPSLVALLKPQSVLDVGCGLGTFVRAFQNAGVSRCIGVDGAWVNRALLAQYIAPEQFIEADLEKPLRLNQTFDLVLSVEVAEHLSEARADSFVEDLCRLSDQIAFSAAIPGQGGDHHINEQWPAYWQEKFEKQGYVLLDILREPIWEVDRIFWWYRQNLFLYVKKDSELHKQYSDRAIKPLRVVHPDLYFTWTNYRDPNALKRYTKALFKAILFRLGIIR
jgi:SAM-dependent methyltransferase